MHLATVGEANELIKEHIMGKYVIGWLLGVPVIVLGLVYLVMN